MRRLLLAAIAAAILASTAAFAGDLLPTKAASQNPFLIQNGSGWYVGVGSSASVAQSSVSGNNVFATSLVNGNLTADGATVDAVWGYIWARQGFWARFQATGSYENVTAGTPLGGGASLAARWSASQEADIGLNVFQTLLTPVLSVVNANINFPTFTPTLPSNITVGAPQQYVGVGVKEVGLSGTIGAASGSQWLVEPMLTSGFVWPTLGSNGKPNGGAIEAFAGVAFPVNGLTLNNVFAANGAPLTIGASVSLGTQYWLGLHVLFGL